MSMVLCGVFLIIVNLANPAEAPIAGNSKVFLHDEVNYLITQELVNKKTGSQVMVLVLKYLKKVGTPEADELVKKLTNG